MSRIRISREFEFSKGNVTQAQKPNAGGNNPSDFDECRPTSDVEIVPGNDGPGFVAQLNERDAMVRYTGGAGACPNAGDSAYVEQFGP